MKKTDKKQSKSRQEALNELTAGLEQSIKDFMDGDKYRAFLSKMSHLHNYSLNNQILIDRQRPDATLCASYTCWKSLNRQVKKGESGIQIICPSSIKFQSLKDVRDENGRPVTLPDGSVKQEVVERIIPFFTKSIRTTGGSFLFYYLVLCSYANYRTSYRRMEHITYTIGPGEWICTVTDLQEWFRCRFQHQALSILRFFEEQNYITYSLLGKNRLVKFKISDWPKDNTVLEYNYPCKKDTGFFFFPIAKVHELIGIGKCSEMDVILDLWIHAVYNDSSVLGSDSGPIVYYRDNTGNPLTSFNELGERWSLSKASVSRLLKKLEEKEYITLISFTGKHGSVIYLNNYLSVMFNISDVMIDKEEIAMKMQLPIHVPEEITIEDSASVSVSETVTDSQITVTKNDSCVPDSHMKFIVQKVAELLDSQGIPCCHCSKTRYILSPLSACKDIFNTFTLNIICPYGNAAYRFELSVSPGDESAQKMPAVAEPSALKGGE